VDFVLVLILAVVGWFAGAAVWVVAHAQAAKRPPFRGPACDACGAPLGRLAWLPLFGFGTARRCAACGVTQSPLRPLFELAVAAFFALLAARQGWDLDLLAAVLFALPLLVILLVDWWTKLIYTNMIGAGLLLGFGFALIDGYRALINSLLSATGAVVVFGLLFVLAAVIYRNVRVVPFGLGDVYLAAMIGAMVRYPLVVSALFLGIFLAGIILMLLLATKRVDRRSAVPYGPFLCAGGLFALLAI